MYELEKTIELYKERFKSIVYDIGQLQYQISEKLENKKNLEKLIEILEREEF